ncbi:phosphoribulokinase, chloroplastic-like [Aristolochia californica]|uniref:phosphoribulokinase, chloroplastic-like n=1 Tax=Aristolochia californica TaxID=171875 RepID=UPI0035DD49FB
MNYVPKQGDSRSICTGEACLLLLSTRRLIGLATESSYGESTFMRRLTMVFGGAEEPPPKGGNMDSNTLVDGTTPVICLDDYNSLDRLGSKENGVTALDPRANNFDLVYHQYSGIRFKMRERMDNPALVDGRRELHWKILRVRLVIKEDAEYFDPVHLFDENSTIDWIPCGRKLTCSYPGIKFYYGPETSSSSEVSVLEMDGQFDKLEELTYVESHLSNISNKFYGEVTQ